MLTRDVMQIKYMDIFKLNEPNQSRINQTKLNLYIYIYNTDLCQVFIYIDTLLHSFIVIFTVMILYNKLIYSIELW